MHAAALPSRSSVGNTRKLALAGFLACAGLIGIALYLQYETGLEPCPLCMIERLWFAGLGLVFLVAALHGPRGWGTKVYGVLALACSLTGASFAVRHVWLQFHPPEDLACTADLFFQLKRYPWLSVVERALRATGDCAKVDWTLFGLSIAEWSLVWFVILTVWSIVYLTRRDVRAAALAYNGREFGGRQRGDAR